MKHFAKALAMVSIFLLSTTISVIVSSGHSSFRTILVTPMKNSITAQYQTSGPIIITSNSDFAQRGLPGVGTRSDPYRLENLEISDDGSCIQIQDTTAFFVVSNCKLESSELYPVIIFDNVENGRVEQCEIAGGSNGLSLTQSQDCFIEENFFYSCWTGVGLFSTSNSTFIENGLHGNNRGLTFDQSDHCVLINNSIYSNFENGIQISSDSYNNTIYGNSIGWNDISGVIDENVVDNGENNTFDDGISVGNFWSDFNESESYVIPGTSGSTDQFAELLEDNTSPGIIPEEDIIIDVETSGNILTWSVYDLFPNWYLIEEDDTNVISGIWIGREISYSIDHLDVGTHTIRLTIYDGVGNWASDGVFVAAISYVLGGIGTELVMIASGITVAIFVIIIILIKRLS